MNTRSTITSTKLDYWAGIKMWVLLLKEINLEKLLKYKDFLISSCHKKLRLKSWIRNIPLNFLKQLNVGFNILSVDLMSWINKIWGFYNSFHRSHFAFGRCHCTQNIPRISNSNDPLSQLRYSWRGIFYNNPMMSSSICSWNFL